MGEVESELDGSTGSGRASAEATIVLEVALWLGKYPTDPLASCDRLLAHIRRRLESLEVLDVSPVVAAQHELSDILGEPLTGNGELLAAGWLLRLRPEHTEQQARIDLGGMDIPLVNKDTGSTFATSVKSGSDSAFRHIAALCLYRWTERWRVKQPETPRSVIQPTRGHPSPRSRDIAVKLLDAVDERFDALADDPRFRDARLKAWRGSLVRTSTSADLKRGWRTFVPRSRRLAATIAAGVGVLAIGLAIVWGASGAMREEGSTTTATVVYRPTAVGSQTNVADVQGEQGLTCWDSSVSPRRDAYSCARGELYPLFDPCFRVPGEVSFVACPSVARDDAGSWSASSASHPVSSFEPPRADTKGLRVPIDEAQSRWPWALVVDNEATGKSISCVVDFDAMESDLPASYTCGTYRVRYASDLQDMIDGVEGGGAHTYQDSGAFTAFDLNRDEAVWTIRIPRSGSAEYREAKVRLAYF